MSLASEFGFNLQNQNPLRSSSQLIPSLMWPPGVGASIPPAAGWEGDLGLAELIAAFGSDRRYLPYFQRTLTSISADAEVIAWRQAIFADFMRSPELVTAVEKLLPRLADLKYVPGQFGQRKRNTLLETTNRLAQLELYVEVVQDLHDALQKVEPRSDGLCRLRDSLAAMIQDERFQSLRQELPSLQAPLQKLASLTIGVNLDMQLRPTGAVLLAINDQPYGETLSFLERLLGTRDAAQNTSGIAPLHQLPPSMEERPLTPLFQDLERLLTQTAQPIAVALARYVQINSNPLTPLENELAFYAAAAGLIERLRQQGIPFCQPEIAPADERVTDISGLLNLALAIHDETPPIASDTELGPQGRIGILTGPNSGGKTTFLRAVGLAHVLFEAGLFVPAQRARISPIDAIYLHFPALESRQQGRLAEEAERLRGIFQQASRYSLVLLNESLSSTTPDEALYLARDVLAGLRAIGVRGLFATHLIDLATQTAEIEQAAAGDSSLFSLVVGVQTNAQGQTVPTYRVERGAPLGYSYAREIARRHGISLEQILQARQGKNGKMSQ